MRQCVQHKLLSGFFHEQLTVMRKLVDEQPSLSSSIINMIYALFGFSKNYDNIVQIRNKTVITTVLSTVANYEVQYCSTINVHVVLV